MEYQKQKETPYEVLVYESLKQKILSGGYAAGEKIPEQSVSEELDLKSAIAGVMVSLGCLIDGAALYKWC